MNHQLDARRRAWQLMSPQDKQQRLESLRRRQQREIELEMLRLRDHAR